MFEFCSTSAMATGRASSPFVSSAPKRAKRTMHHAVTTELSFRRAGGQFSYAVGACKEAVLLQNVGGQCPVHERSAC